MIKDKKTPNNQPEPQDQPKVIVPEQEYLNPFVEMYNAVKRTLLTIREDPTNPHSPPFFKTIAVDNGQFLRIIRDTNLEMEVAFPAIFIHFVNVRYLVQQQRIGEGRATMRIRFVLNNLNSSDPDKELEPFVVFQRINVAIQNAKSKEPAINERCNLTYFDMPTTTNQLQAYWVDYEVWFREASAWKYKDWIERYMVIPPFTNHDDAPEHDTNNHGNHSKPKYNESSKFEPSVELGEEGTEEQE